MRLTLFFVFLSTTYLSYSQKILTYQGPFEIETSSNLYGNSKGFATYEYYEDENFERIFHGSFSYKEGDNYSITGSFENNTRTGFWKASSKIRNSSTNQLLEIIATANYNAGNLEGVCNYSCVDVNSKKVLAKSIANFRDNIMVGTFTYSEKYGGNDFTIDFTLNQDGFLDSTFKIVYALESIKYEDSRKYIDGYLYWALHRKMSDGSILRKLDRKLLVNEIVNNFDKILGYAFIPYAEFEAEETLIYLSKVNEAYNRSHNLATPINSKTVAYRNAPFSFITTSIDFDNHEAGLSDIYSAINIWVNSDCQYCGAMKNPLYRFPKGANPVYLNSVKELALHDKLFKQIKEDSIISKNIETRKLLIDSLKLAVYGSIDWVQVVIDSNQGINFTISKIPVTQNQYLGWRECRDNSVENFKKDYFGSLGNHDKDNKRLLQCIDDVKHKRVVNYSYGGNYNNQPYGNINHITIIADWLGLRLATKNEVELAISKGLISPKKNDVDYVVYWFVRQ